MNEQVRAFLWRAARRDILTPNQCIILRELFANTGTVEDCYRLIAENMMLDQRRLQALRLQIDTIETHSRKATVDKQSLGEDLEALLQQSGPDEPSAWEPDPGLEWFCYLAVNRGLLTREMCLSVFADVEGAQDLLGFAQSVMNVGLCRDLSLIQELIDEALESWAHSPKPPVTTFS